jgi:hypothetical protein
MPRNPPEILEVERDQLDQFLRRAEEQLAPEDYQLLRALWDSYACLTDLVADKQTTIGRLRQWLFGARTEKTEAVVGRSDDSPPAAGRVGDGAPRPGDESQEGAAGASGDAASGDAASGDAASGDAASGDAASGDAASGDAASGHGRHGADAYTTAARVDVRHATLQPGDPCPACDGGTLYASRPGVLVRVVGQAPLQATVYRVQKLRCGLCGQLFTAELPAEAGGRKYDATAASLIALLKYGSGLPFNRLAGLQGNLGVPLPAATQWEIVAAFADELALAYEELIRQAAQGDVVYHDDTTVKILELLRQRGGADGDAEASRRGLFTSGVVATCEGWRIALFFSGRQHAGENLQDVLAQRAAELARPIQMCDALSRNLVGELKTILAHCLAHARRQFVELYDRSPDECRQVLEALKVVYHHDALAREQELSPQARLAFHQRESGPTMVALHTWLNAQLDAQQVEPNSALGEAFRYLLRHWEPLTLFLREPGAPLDNNLCERALKKAILHRKNSYFYKTANGAWVGDLYMSLIHPCELCGVNAFDYLTSLHGHLAELAATPAAWMPWNYRETRAALAANPPAAAAQAVGP